MWLFVDELVVWFESAYGYKQTSSRPKSTSAYHPASDIPDRVGNDRF